eukprot:Gb_28339 [translate_table: standard]
MVDCNHEKCKTILIWAFESINRRKNMMRQTSEKIGSISGESTDYTMALVKPLATLLDRKCKRCGLYEEDALTSDDTFDEWELCPDEFSPPPEGRYKRFKEKEFNATFLCSQCNVSESGTAAKPTTTDPINPNSAASAKRNFNSRLGIVILCASFVVLVAIVIVLYKLWEKKKREEQQARFLKLFEEDDDLEVELGLRDEL